MPGVVGPRECARTARGVGKRVHTQVRASAGARAISNAIITRTKNITPVSARVCRAGQEVAVVGATAHHFLLEARVR
jgi:hypothetical protein